MRTVTLLVSRFAWNSGAGGHYYSYQTLAESLEDYFELHLVVVGSAKPQALKDIDEKIHFVSATPGPSGRRALERRLARIADTDCFIAFDRASAMLLRRYCRRTSAGLVWVKAGGPWPKRYFPKVNVQVHFSLKDYKRARNEIATSSGKAFYIPNRVSPMPSETADADALSRELRLQPDEIVIIRIGRVSEIYKAAFEGALALRRLLSEAGYKARAILIGNPQSIALAAELEKQCEPGFDELLTDPSYTNNAARFLPLAHINVGVGRGFMEGASLGQHMFAIASGAGLPVKVNDDNLEEFLAENFSMRVRLDYPEAQRRKDALDIAEGIREGRTRDQQARIWFETWFSAQRMPVAYTEAITAAEAQPERFNFDYLLTELWVLIAPIKEWLSSLKRALG